MPMLLGGSGASSQLWMKKKTLNEASYFNDCKTKNVYFCIFFQIILLSEQYLLKEVLCMHERFETQIIKRANQHFLQQV